MKRGTRPNGPRGRYDGTFVEDYEYAARAVGAIDVAGDRFEAAASTSHQAHPRGVDRPTGADRQAFAQAPAQPIGIEVE